MSELFIEVTSIYGDVKVSILKASIVSFASEDEGTHIWMEGNGFVIKETYEEIKNMLIE